MKVKDEDRDEYYKVFWEMMMCGRSYARYTLEDGDTVRLTHVPLAEIETSSDDPEGREAAKKR